MQSEEKLCFMALPFGKLLPSINKISGTLSMQKHNWIANWIHACNTADTHSVMALSMLLNEWRETEIYYRVPKSELKYHSKHYYANHICNVLQMLTKNQDSVNHNVELILVEILSFYYRRFDTVEVFLTFGEFIDEIITATQKLIFNHITIKNKENPKELQKYPEKMCIAVYLGHLIDLLRDYDEKGPKKKKSLDPSPQSLEQAKIVMNHILELKCMAQLLSTFVFIKIDFITFFQLHYDKQLQQYRLKNKPLGDKKINEKRREMDQLPKNNLNIASDNGVNGVKQVQFEGTLTSSILSIRKIINLLTKAISNPRLFFAYMTPLLRYLPILVINCTCQQEQTMVFEKILVPIMEQLSRVFDDKMSNIFSNYKQTFQFSQVDIVRGFNNTSFMDDLEMTLIAQFESKIQQHKQVEEYQDQYIDLQKYFMALSNFKTKIVKAFENLSGTFQVPLIFQQPSEFQQPQRPLKQSQNKNLQSDLCQQSNRTVTINNKKINGSRISHVQGNPERKKPGPKPKLKQSHYKKEMPNILQVPNEDQQATDTGEQIKPLKSNKNKQKKEKKPRKSKRQVEHNQGDKNEEDSFSMNLKPLQKKHRSVSPAFNQSNESLQKTKNSPEPSDQIRQRLSKSLERKSSQGSEKNRFVAIRPQQFVTYYQHQSNTFNARKIFREDRIQYAVPDVKTPYWFYGRYVYRYPKFINTEYFENPIVQTFQTDYEQLKSVKSVLYPRVKNHKFFVRSIFDQSQRLNRQILKYEYECNKKKKPTVQLNQDYEKLVKMTYQVNKMKVKNLQFYLNYSRKYERITQVSIRLYPLVKKTYGLFTLKELTKLTQRYLYYLVNYQSLDQQSETNVYNKKLRTILEMINLPIDTFKSDKLHELFMPMLFEIMHAINTSQKSMDSFYHLYFKIIPPHMQSMVLFYMFEIQRERPFEYELLFRSLFLIQIQAQDIFNLLKFMIKDAKLNSMELKKMYEQIYQLLSERCLMMIKIVQELLCHDILPLIKQESDKKERQRFKKQTHNLLESLKIKFFESSSTMIDLINVWLCLGYSSMNYEPNLPSKHLQPNRKVPLVYFCNTCGSSQTIQVSPKKSSNFPSSICHYCSTSLMDRFELQSNNLFWIDLDKKREMQKTICDSSKTINKFFKNYEWKVKRLPLFEYKEDFESGQGRLMELYDDDERRNQAQKQQKVQKSEEEIIQEDNEQYCLASCQFLTVYYEDLTQIFTKALNF